MFLVAVCIVDRRLQLRNKRRTVIRSFTDARNQIPDLPGDLVLQVQSGFFVLSALRNSSDSASDLAVRFLFFHVAERAEVLAISR